MDLEKNKPTDTWTIRNVPKETRNTILKESKKKSYSIAEYLTYLVDIQPTTVRNIDAEAISAATMMANRLSVPLSQFISNAILKEVKDVVQGKADQSVAIFSEKNIMTVDKVETMIKDLKSEMIEIIKEIRKDSSPKEKFFGKLKEKIFK